jgi:hypothetical protein
VPSWCHVGSHFWAISGDILVVILGRSWESSWGVILGPSWKQSWGGIQGITHDLIPYIPCFQYKVNRDAIVEGRFGFRV